MPDNDPDEIGQAARNAIMDAIDILDTAGTPLPFLLAKQAATRPDLILKAMGRFSPSATKQALLPTLQALHLQALRALAARDNQTLIDVTPSDDWLK